MRQPDRTSRVDGYKAFAVGHLAYDGVTVEAEGMFTPPRRARG
ncbi:hypothetical protein [Mycolicibacterium doricum]